MYFSIVDYAYDKAPKNLKGLVFDTGQPSFLAGYVAAAKSESGIVGTFGGLNIPTVTAFMKSSWSTMARPTTAPPSSKRWAIR